MWSPGCGTVGSADAFLHDKAAALFFDPAKLHALQHRGTHF